MLIQNGFKREARNAAQGTGPVAASKGLRAAGRFSGSRAGSFLRSGEEGQGLVEIRLVLPLLLILLTGIFTFGIAYINQMTLTNAVGVGAQTLQVIRSTTTDPCKDVYNAITKAAPNFNASNITMTITMNGNTPITANSCSSDVSELSAGTTNTVKATYPCNLAIYGRTFAPGCTLSATVATYEY